MAKQWDFELDWAEDEQETIAREDHDSREIPDPPISQLDTAVVRSAAAVVAERLAVQAEHAAEAVTAEHAAVAEKMAAATRPAPVLPTVPFDPRQTIMGLGFSTEEGRDPAEDPNVTRPTPGGSRGGYPSPEELEKYNRPTRPIVEQSSLADFREAIDAGRPIAVPAMPGMPAMPAPAPAKEANDAPCDDLDAATTEMKVAPDLRDPAPRSAPPPFSAAQAAPPSPRMLARPIDGGPHPVAVPASVVPHALPNRTTTRGVAVSARSARRTGSWVVLAVAVVAGLMAGVWFGAPREGELRVDVASADGTTVEDARVYVGGDLRCRTVPCVVRGLKPGIETIRIESDDLPQAILRTAEITAGQEQALSVRLPAPELLGLRIVEMPGVTEVLVDGVSRGAPPLLIDDLEPGEHHVQFNGDELFAPAKRIVEIEDGTIVEIRDVKLEPVPDAKLEEDAATARPATLRRPAPVKNAAPEEPEAAKPDVVEESAVESDATDPLEKPGF